MLTSKNAKKNAVKPTKTTARIDKEMSIAEIARKPEKSVPSIPKNKPPR